MYGIVVCERQVCRGSVRIYIPLYVCADSCGLIYLQSTVLPLCGVYCMAPMVCMYCMHGVNDGWSVFVDVLGQISTYDLPDRLSRVRQVGADDP